MAPSFVSPVWAVRLLILMLVAAAAATMQGGDCPASICGNVTIVEPFGIVSEHATASNCGQIGFLVTCQDDTPYLSYYSRGNETYGLQILAIFYGNSSLLVADMRKLTDLANLSHKDCQQYKFPSSNTSSKIAQPLSISPINQQLILYNCVKAPPLPPQPAAAEGLVERTCGNSTFIARVGGSYGELDSYVLEGCQSVVVPTLSKSSGKANASNYAQLISDGFLLTWQSRAGKFILGTKLMLSIWAIKNSKQPNVSLIIGFLCFSPTRAAASGLIEATEYGHGNPNHRSSACYLLPPLMMI
ncbi:unnamed protein product [Urochloa humidicola]